MEFASRFLAQGTADDKSPFRLTFRENMANCARITAMESAVPNWENRATPNLFRVQYGSALMTPTSENPFAGVFMLSYLWIAIGGALGSIGRYWLNGIISARFATFPMGTLLVNVIGSFIIGVVGALTLPEGRMSSESRWFTTQFVMIGICGGFTTFSSFSFQTLNLLRDREWLYAGGNVLLSVVVCLFATWLGFLLGSACTSMKGN
jgi:CrcB protein